MVVVEAGGDFVDDDVVPVQRHLAAVLEVVVLKDVMNLLQFNKEPSTQF